MTCGHGCVCVAEVEAVGGKVLQRSNLGNCVYCDLGQVGPLGPHVVHFCRMLGPC